MHLLGEPSLHTTRGDFSTHYLRDTWGGLMYQLGGVLSTYHLQGYLGGSLHAPPGKASLHAPPRGGGRYVAMHHLQASVGLCPCTVGQLGGSLHVPPGGLISTYHLWGICGALSTHCLQGTWGGSLHVPPGGSSLHTPPGGGSLNASPWGAPLDTPPGGALSMHHL